MQLTSFPFDKDKRFPYFLYSSSSRIDVEKRMTEKSSTWMEIRSFSFHLSSSSFADLFGCKALDSVPSELEIENLSVNLWSATIAMYAILLSILKEENGKGSKLRKVTMLLLIQQIWIFFTQVFKIFPKLRHHFLSLESIWKISSHGNSWEWGSFPSLYTPIHLIHLDHLSNSMRWGKKSTLLS